MNADKEKILKELNDKYKYACRKDSKKELLLRLEKFIDDDTVLPNKKQRVVQIISEMITLEYT